MIPAHASLPVSALKVADPRVYLPEGVGPWCKCGSRFWWRTAGFQPGFYKCESCGRMTFVGEVTAR